MSDYGAAGAATPVPPSGGIERTQTALVLSAGAPHSPLMAGALCAIYDKGKSFDIIYTSGAGALIGLLFAAPKGKDPATALRGVLDLAIADEIYRYLPINYKVFMKPGPYTRPIHAWAQLFKLGDSLLPPIVKPALLDHVGKDWVDVVGKTLNAGHGRLKRLYNDLIDLWAAAITPAALTYYSKGLCEPLPFLEDVVDFGKLNEVKKDFFINFMSQSDALAAARTPTPGKSGTGKAMKLFESGFITPAHVRAAFAYPFIYKPVQIDGELNFEGANWEPISFGNLLDRKNTAMARIKNVVVMDIVSQLEPFLLREPRNLLDAFGLSIILPVVAHAKKEMARFEFDENARRRKHPFHVEKIAFRLNEASGSHITDWSYSNMSRMFGLGYEAGEKFCAQKGDILPDRNACTMPRWLEATSAA